MPVTLFFRKSVPGFFSIERLFGNLATEMRQVGVRHVCIPYKSAFNPIKLLSNIFYAFRKQSDVNHITGEIYYIAFGLNRKRTLLTIHDIESLYSNNKLKNWLLELFWLKLPVKWVKYVTVISEHSKRKLIEVTGVKEEKVFVVPNCISFRPDDFKPKESLSENVPMLFQVGTKPNKNLENLATALEGIPCKLLIIGKLSCKQERLLKLKNIQYEAYYNLTNEEVQELYYRTDIVSFVSLYEGFGLPILEANAIGRPVITSNTTAMPEVAGDAALLVNPFDPTQIRYGILKLLKDKVLRDELVKNGQKNIQRFKPEVIANQYEAIYQRVISENA